MEGLTMNDHTPVEQSNGNTAIPIAETVTPNQVEGHDSNPTHLGQDNVIAQPVIQHSNPSSQESSKSSSFGQLKSQISGPQHGCHGDNLQRTVEAEQSMKFTGFVSAPTESLPGPSASQIKSYREHGREPSKSQGPKHWHFSKPGPVESSHGNTEYDVGHMTGGPFHQGRNFI